MSSGGKAAANQGGRVVSDRPSSSYAPAVFAKEPDAGRTTKHAFGAAMNRLFHAHLIEVRETGPASRRTHQLVRVAAEPTMLLD